MPTMYFMEKQEEKEMTKTIPYGDCFEWAYKFIKETDDEDGAILVHANVRHPFPGPEERETFEHAWVEMGGKVYDWQNMMVRGKGSVLIDEFYETWKPFEIVKYTKEEAIINLIKNRNYGPWELS